MRVAPEVDTSSITRTLLPCTPCAERLKANFIFSWKPQPAHLVGNFEPQAVRAYVRHTLEVCQANGCVLEMILKDTHTCEHHPERFDVWTQVAREEIQRQSAEKEV